jgi:hypothetical protein
MSDSTLRQIAQLNGLSFSGLQARWCSLFGTEPPAYHRRFLVKRLAYRTQELAYGSLPQATRAQMGEVLQDAGRRSGPMTCRWRERGWWAAARRPRPSLLLPSPGPLLRLGGHHTGTTGRNGKSA